MPDGVIFKRTDLEPPMALYVPPGSYLEIRHFAAYQAQKVRVELNVMLPSGEQTVNAYEVGTTADYSIKTVRYPLAECYILSCVIVPLVSGIRMGEVYDNVLVVSATAGLGNVIQVLYANYVVGGWVFGFPRNDFRLPTEGHGGILAVTVPNPAAGANFSYQLPANIRWRVHGVRLWFTTSAVVGNRYVGILFTAAGGQTIHFYANFTQPENFGQAYVFADGATGVYNAYNTFHIGIGHVELNQQGTVDSIVGGIQAGDQISDIYLWVEQWVEL